MFSLTVCASMSVAGGSVSVRFHAETRMRVGLGRVLLVMPRRWREIRWRCRVGFLHDVRYKTRPLEGRKRLRGRLRSPAIFSAMRPLNDVHRKSR